MDDLRNKRVTVCGLGNFGGGTAVTRWLVERGARVLVTDRAKAEELKDSLEEIADLDVERVIGEHRERDFAEADLVVASPAVPPQGRYLQLARERGVPVTTEIRLFIERCRARRIVGVTGTKGKSTTTALLGLMLRARHRVHVGGNIGRSLLASLPEIGTDDLVVLELSSYMLEYLAEARWSPHVALVTMMADDHLERHKTYERYLDAKLEIVRHQGAGDFAVLRDEPAHDAFAAAARGRVVRYGPGSARAFETRLPGAHNRVNALGAFAAAQLLGVTWDEAQEAIRDFAGLPHRLHLAHEGPGGVRYVNDSIATIPEAAAAALRSFPRGTVLQVVGGYDKGLDLSKLAEALAGHAKAALCIGQTGPAIAAAVASCGGRAEVCGTLAAAVNRARELAAPGDVVLLSPGCASFGQFTNFEHRGREFERLAREG